MTFERPVVGGWLVALPLNVDTQHSIIIDLAPLNFER